jgi:hypothetical protein
MKTGHRNLVFDSILRWISDFVRPLSPILDRFGVFWGKQSAFLIVVCIYLILQAYVTLPLINHQLPIGGDDGYVYILKAAEIKDGCFTQNCPALNDLRMQLLTPTENLDSAASRNREYTRLFVIYHPLHSFILAGLNSLGISFESAFDLVYLVGKIFIPLAVAFWLKAVWGSRIGTTGLILLSPVVFASQGLHLSIPTTLCAALAFATWGTILNGKPRADYFIIPLIIAMILMHNVGIIYAAIALFLYLLSSSRPLTRRAKMVAGALFLIIVSALLLPYLISRPELRFDTVSFYPGNWNYLAAFIDSLPGTLVTISEFMKSFWHPLVFMALVGIGFLVLPTHQRSKIALTAISLIGLVFLGIAFVVPWYGAFIFERFWPIVAIFLMGAVASAVNAMIEALWAQSKKILKRRVSDLHNPSTLLTRQGWQIAILAISGLVVGVALMSNMMLALRNYIDNIYSVKQTPDIYFSSEQPNLIHANAGTSETILYMDEVAMYYYLSHGSLQMGAIYQPALRFTHDLDKWVESRKAQIAYVVQLNPFFSLPHSPDGGLKLGSSETLILRGIEPIDTGHLELFFAERTNKVTLQISSENLKEDIILEVPEGPAQWISFPPDIPLTNIIRIKLRGLGENAEIAGMRFSPDSATRWPWGASISLDFKTPDDQVATIDFNPSSLADGLIENLTVLDDYGYTILAKVNP